MRARTDAKAERSNDSSVFKECKSEKEEGNEWRRGLGHRKKGAWEPLGAETDRFGRRNGRAEGSPRRARSSNARVRIFMILKIGMS